MDEPEPEVSEAQFGLMFVPERWSPARRLARFAGPPFKHAGALASAARSAENRRNKFELLTEIRSVLRPGLEQDLVELDQRGHCEAKWSKRFAAIAEAQFLELYSSLDALREAIYFAYKNVQRIQNKSNERFLKLAHDNHYGQGFPEPIRENLAAAYNTWFPGLRQIRIALSHGDVGTCHLSSESRVTYFHDRLRTAGNNGVIFDIEEELKQNAVHVHSLIDSSCSYLCSQLQPVVKREPCGFYKALLYEREVAYSDDMTFASGVCYSRVWFESRPETLCPLRTQCAAYSR